MHVIWIRCNALILSGYNCTKIKSLAGFCVTEVSSKLWQNHGPLAGRCRTRNGQLSHFMSYCTEITKCQKTGNWPLSLAHQMSDIIIQRYSNITLLPQLAANPWLKKHGWKEFKSKNIIKEVMESAGSNYLLIRSSVWSWALSIHDKQHAKFFHTFSSIPYPLATFC